MIETARQDGSSRFQQEEAVVRQYALRWAVLAAWRDALAGGGSRGWPRWTWD